MSFLIGFLYVIFVIACILLIVVILLQEGKGGGLGEAFGGIGGETFGHKAGGVNKFTSVLAAVVMVSAIVIHTLGASGGGSAGSFVEKPQGQGAIDQPLQPPLPSPTPPPSQIPESGPGGK
jgi:preprotein translocase subunit SecG